jgi:DNA-binding PadR family transcriptional regulator
MQTDESTGDKAPARHEGTASEDTTPDGKNPGDWRPDREVVADIRRQLLDGASARALAEQYPVGKDAIRSLAKHGCGTGTIGPLRALGTTGRWVPADTLVADGGVTPQDLTLFQLEILYTLAEGGPDYGLGIKRSLQDLYGESINHGQLYPNLDDLTEMGVVDRSQRDRRTNEYALTDDGHRVVASDAHRRATIYGQDIAPEDIVPTEVVTDGGPDHDVPVEEQLTEAQRDIVDDTGGSSDE